MSAGRIDRAVPENEGIRHVGGNLLGEHGRKIQYCLSGRAPVLMERDAKVFEAERKKRPAPVPDTSGAVELF